MNEEPTLLESVNQLQTMYLFSERFPELTPGQIGQLGSALGAIRQAIEDVEDILWDCPEQDMESPGIELGI